MAEISLPQNLSNVWAGAGDVLKPSDGKIAQGWSAEIPPRQWFNWIDNRQDQGIAHIAQHGIAVWDQTIEYQAGKSYVQGSDGNIYKAVNTNVNSNPVNNVSGNWSSAFIKASDAPVLSNSSIRYANGMVDQWASETGVVPTSVGSTVDITVTLPVKISNFLNVQVTHDLGVDAEAAEMAYSILAKTPGTTTSTVTVRFRRISGSNASGSETVSATVRVMGVTS